MIYDSILEPSPAPIVRVNRLTGTRDDLREVQYFNPASWSGSARDRDHRDGAAC